MGIGRWVMPFIEGIFLNRGAPVSRSTKQGYGTMMTKGGLVGLFLGGPVFLFSFQLKLTWPGPTVSPGALPFAGC